MATQNIRPKILLTEGRVQQPLRVDILDGFAIDPIKTYLTSDTASASGTLTVKNIVGFAVNQILLIGEPGLQGSEIIKTHASTPPSGSTITLASNTALPHSASTFVYVLKFDQVEFSSATTASGTKTIIQAATNILASQRYTEYNDTTATASFYFARFKETIGNTFSPYSDAAPAAGYGIMAARSIIDAALHELNKTTSDVLSDTFAFEQFDSCQMECLRELKRWSWMQKFDNILGQIATGSWTVAMPTDIDDTNTNKSIYKIRIGFETPLIWVDKQQFDRYLDNVAYTTLSSAISVGDLKISLTNSGDFGTDGTAQVGANTYSYASVAITSLTLSGTTATATATAHGRSTGDVVQIYGATQTAYNGSFTITVVDANTFTYTVTGSPATPATGSPRLSGNNTVTGTLWIAASTTSNTNGAVVFNGATFGLPKYWTTYGGNIYYYPATAAQYNGQNIYIDYYSSLVRTIADSTNAIIPDPVLIQYYLCWKFLKRLNNGVDTEESAKYEQRFLDRKTKMKNKEVKNRVFKFRPRFNDFAAQTAFGSDSDRSTKLAGFPSKGF